jgi:hypothetical protein
MKKSQIIDQSTSAVGFEVDQKGQKGLRDAPLYFLPREVFPGWQKTVLVDPYGVYRNS